MTPTRYTTWQFQGANTPLVLGSGGAVELADDELLIENQTSGINPVDWKFIESDPLAWPHGHTPGVDGAGVVVATGAGVADNWLGTPVAYHCALDAPGSFAANTVVKENRVMRIPQGLPYDLAAALPCPLLTAWQAVSKIPYATHARVLVAGMGYVNKLTVQLLRQAGFSVDVLSSSLTIDGATQLGADTLFRQPEDIDKTYHAVIDAVSPDNAAQLVQHLQANGHVVCILGRIEQPVDAPFTRTISYHEVALGALHQYGDATAWQVLMREGEALLGQVVQERLCADMPAVYPFSELNTALAHSQQHKQKTVIGKALS
ncbi:alcohol dehydrogenase catalytic domain-containing protein [Salinimonas sediminis]|uniref:alcohol dehydrogenase catalytic domain-containing protein n=1 Tax=Salinimonas sediminis TaxID=2303538 RepID=UPI001475E5EC|nr:alcohol dehydrogenase catalytic domain-containing protein [Salinimonas sediminis]